MRHQKPAWRAALRLANRQPIGLCGARAREHGIGLAMATSPRSAPGSVSREVRPRGRLHIHGIKEMPAGYDAEVAELFRDLRAVSGLTEADLAAQLATRLEVVQALEHGAIYALPPWPETCRVVSSYGNLLNLDVRPLLRRIYAQVEAGIVELAPKPMPEVPFMAPPEDINRESQVRSRPAGAAAQSFPVQPRQAPSSAPLPGAPAGGRAPFPSPRQGQAQQSPKPQQQPQPQWPPQGHTAPQPQPTQWQQDGRTPPQQPRARQPDPRAEPQSQRSPAPQAQPAPQLRPRAAPQPTPQTQQPAASQPQSRPAPRPAPLETPTAEKSGRRATLLKWGIAALIASGVAFGLWLWLAEPSLLGSGAPSVQSGKSPQAAPPVTDPNDPRSRKSDRLPGPS
jgi:hypothetical protein